MPYLTTSKNGLIISKKEIIFENEQYKKLKTSELKGICSYAISSAGLDALTQQNAALGIYPPERCEAIKSYISACRNEYLRCKQLILAAQTNDEADAIQYIAPVTPEGM